MLRGRGLCLFYIKSLREKDETQFHSPGGEVQRNNDLENMGWNPLYLEDIPDEAERITHGTSLPALPLLSLDFFSHVSTWVFLATLITVNESLVDVF